MKRKEPEDASEQSAGTSSVPEKDQIAWGDAGTGQENN